MVIISQYHVPVKYHINFDKLSFVLKWIFWKVISKMTGKILWVTVSLQTQFQGLLKHLTIFRRFKEVSQVPMETISGKALLLRIDTQYHLSIKLPFRPALLVTCWSGPLPWCYVWQAIGITPDISCHMHDLKTWCWSLDIER